MTSSSSTSAPHHDLVIFLRRLDALTGQGLSSTSANGQSVGRQVSALHARALSLQNDLLRGNDRADVERRISRMGDQIEALELAQKLDALQSLGPNDAPPRQSTGVQRPATRLYADPPLANRPGFVTPTAGPPYRPSEPSESAGLSRKIWERSPAPLGPQQGAPAPLPYPLGSDGARAEAGGAEAKPHPPPIPTPGTHRPMPRLTPRPELVRLDLPVEDPLAQPRESSRPPLLQAEAARPPLPILEASRRPAPPEAARPPTAAEHDRIAPQIKPWTDEPAPSSALAVQIERVEPEVSASQPLRGERGALGEDSSSREPNAASARVSSKTGAKRRLSRRGSSSQRSLLGGMSARMTRQLIGCAALSLVVLLTVLVVVLVGSRGERTDKTAPLSSNTIGKPPAKSAEARDKAALLLLAAAASRGERTDKAAPLSSDTIGKPPANTAEGRNKAALLLSAAAAASPEVAPAPSLWPDSTDSTDKGSRWGTRGSTSEVRGAPDDISTASPSSNPPAPGRSRARRHRLN